jgi:hypothetical protein
MDSRQDNPVDSSDGREKQRSRQTRITYPFLFSSYDAGYHQSIVSAINVSIRQFAVQACL